MATEQPSTRCRIVGGGPCGLMLGVLLARAGVDVIVLEKHDDFLRDFRGATIHPSTIEMMFELGLLHEFLALQHQREEVVVEDLGAPMDALWFWLPKRPDDPIKTTSSLEAGRSIVLMDRGDYWQCALMILKGSIDETRRAGLPALRAEVAHLVPTFADRVDTL